MEESLIEPQANFERAAEALIVATKKAFPIGALVSVTLGKTRVQGTVVSSGGSWWYDPDRVVISNVATGKHRKFAAASRFTDACVIERPVSHPRICRGCGCTDDDCSQCIEKTGHACHWVEPDLCSACKGEG